MGREQGLDGGVHCAGNLEYALGQLNSDNLHLTTSPSQTMLHHRSCHLPELSHSYSQCQIPLYPQTTKSCSNHLLLLSHIYSAALQTRPSISWPHSLAWLVLTADCPN